MPRKRQDDSELADEYFQLISPHLELAKKAYGSRKQNTPAHHASRQYTSLLVRYYERGGSLQALAEKLGVTYAGLRRRVITAGTDVPPVKRRRDVSEEELYVAARRVLSARARGSEYYHEALAKEREAGIPLALLAKSMGLANTAPMYYGISRYYAKKKK